MVQRSCNQAENPTLRRKLDHPKSLSILQLLWVQVQYSFLMTESCIEEDTIVPVVIEMWLFLFSYRKADFFPSTHYESVRTLKTYDHTAMAAAVRSEFPGLRTVRTHGMHGTHGRHGKEVPVLADGASGSQVHETLGLPPWRQKKVL